MENKKKNFLSFIFKFIFIVIFISYLTLYFSTSNYYEYEQYRKTTLTKEQIEKFEQDVRDGKQVDIKDYMVEDKKDYSNNISKIGVTLTKGIESAVSFGLNKIIKFLNNTLT